MKTQACSYTSSLTIHREKNRATNTKNIQEFLTIEEINSLEKLLSHLNWAREHTKEKDWLNPHFLSQIKEDFRQSPLPKALKEYLWSKSYKSSVRGTQLNHQYHSEHTKKSYSIGPKAPYTIKHLLGKLITYGLAKQEQSQFILLEKAAPIVQKEKTQSKQAKDKALVSAFFNMFNHSLEGPKQLYQSNLDKIAAGSSSECVAVANVSNKDRLLVANNLNTTMPKKFPKKDYEFAMYQQRDSRLKTHCEVRVTENVSPWNIDNIGISQPSCLHCSTALQAKGIGAFTGSHLQFYDSEITPSIRNHPYFLKHYIGKEAYEFIGHNPDHRLLGQIETMRKTMTISSESKQKTPKAWKPTYTSLIEKYIQGNKRYTELLHKKSSTKGKSPLKVNIKIEPEQLQKNQKPFSELTKTYKDYFAPHTLLDCYRLEYIDYHFDALSKQSDIQSLCALPNHKFDTLIDSDWSLLINEKKLDLSDLLDLDDNEFNDFMSVKNPRMAFDDYKMYFDDLYSLYIESPLHLTCMTQNNIDELFIDYAENLPDALLEYTDKVDNLENILDGFSCTQRQDFLARYVHYFENP
jgi:hypothetical protein